MTLQWGHWGHDGWHHIGDSGTDVVALRWGQWDRCGGTEVMGKGWVALRGDIGDRWGVIEVGMWRKEGWH